LLVAAYIATLIANLAILWLAPHVNVAANEEMHPSGEVGRFQLDNLSSPPGDW
jgi:hypothetical protein